MGLFGTVPGCTCMYLPVPSCTWLCHALLIYFTTDRHSTDATDWLICSNAIRGYGMGWDGNLCLQGPRLRASLYVAAVILENSNSFHSQPASKTFPMGESSKESPRY